jgi:DNA-binding MarR family transcriptional regulator
MVCDAEVLLDEISEGLPEVSRLLSGPQLATATDWKLSVAQWRLLRALPDRMACSVAELAHRLGVSRSALVSLVDGLIELGLVERNAGLSDRRATYLRLSPAGREARDTFRRWRRRRTAAALGRLHPQQLKTIADSVAILREALLESGLEPAAERP